MKSLEELKAIRDKARKQMNIRKEKNDAVKVLVGMATCGIAAGAKSVLNTFVEEISKRELNNVTVTQTVLTGDCKAEPVVEVLIPGKEKVTYINMTPEKAIRVVNDHIVNNNVVTEYTIGANS